MLFVPLFKQSIPKKAVFYDTCLTLALVRLLIGFNPLFSAKAIGIYYNASANALTAYCSTVPIVSANLLIAKDEAISAAPPP